MIDLRELFYEMDKAQDIVNEKRQQIFETVISNPDMRDRYMIVDWKRLRRDSGAERR